MPITCDESDRRCIIRALLLDGGQSEISERDDYRIDGFDPKVQRRIEVQNRANEGGQTNLLANVRRRWETSEHDEHDGDGVSPSPSESTVCHGHGMLKVVFGIGPKGLGMPSSRLIYPYSKFAVTWLGCTCVFLLYTAIVTPAVISLHWLDDECSTVPTFYFDILLDTFFLVDIVLSFFVGVVYQGNYMDDWKWVAQNYVTGNMAFDVFTSIPVSYVELSIQDACATAAAAGAESGAGIDPGQLRFIRAIKPLRWFKLARIIKLNNSGNLIQA
jgi:hypothetical protein